MTAVLNKCEATTYAHALACAEFGRFYWDDRCEKEMRTSLAKAKIRVREERRKHEKLSRRKSRVS